MNEDEVDLIVQEIKNYRNLPTDSREYNIQSNISNNVKNQETTARDIIEHCESKNFTKKTKNYINTLSKVTGIDKSNDNSLRSAYLEYYVFQLLNLLKKNQLLMKLFGMEKLENMGYLHRHQAVKLEYQILCLLLMIYIL